MTFVRSLFLTVSLLLIASGGSAHASDAQESPIYDSCCICIHDSRQEGLFISACKHWLNERKKSTGCTYRKIVSKVDGMSLENSNDGTRCRSVHLYGAFHGISKMTDKPFQYSAVAAKAYGASSVCYDGLSCLVFDNIDEASIALRYSSGTREGDLCGHVTQDQSSFVGSKNDPNAKWCLDEANLVSQQCCPKKGDRNSRFGKWSAPGKGC
jgi:hypothetical protein